MLVLREPAVAGQFYPGQKAALEQMLNGLVPREVEPKKALAIMSPHAGYIYSGGVAGKTFAEVKIPDDVIILGPNHHGRGHDAAVFAKGGWSMPQGEILVDEELALTVLKHCPMMQADTMAHRYEHSLEVQVPFLQLMSPGSRIVPICISQLPLAMLLKMGDGLAQAIQVDRRETLIVASSDMTHYESGEVARRKDFLALERVLELDPQGLYEVVRQNRISMCGVMPTVVMLQAVIGLGATQTELISYSNSGDVTGDQSEVVGYAGVRIS
jgi:AmmeMemoRadiSam system protein B